MVESENQSEMTVTTACEEATSLSGNLLPVEPPKKKRNLPGMPDPDAEVIALSPKTLMATNRFVCEICGKGFQRDQNLQLHRRGHNLPWKLKQRTSKEIRKRVYVCPESSCVHHNPTRALGDLTGIKKHFCRKHGEKKWKCERCSKKYAVQSDWKAHMKTCGSREYKCDCGTLFSRRDSFITHRAFCDALAQESAREQAIPVSVTERNVRASANANRVVTSPPPPPLTPSTTVVSPGVSVQSSELAENPIGISPPTSGATATCFPSSTTTSTSVFASIFAASTPAAPAISRASQASSSFAARPDYYSGAKALEPTSLTLSPSLYLSTHTASLFPAQNQDHRNYTPSPQPALSATALLQKAAQMGVSSSNPSFLRGIALSGPPSDGIVKQERDLVAAGLGLALPSGDVMVGPSSLFGNKPTTLDLFGLGVDAGASSRGFSALYNSFGGDFTVSGPTASYGGRGGSSPGGDTWEGPSERETNGL
ncbi:protein indeterminate-domain 2-like [Tripterygium wilfordii]|uniref:Protein indeterminate-domain 2-like n=1 Tax=Tripterygium wilfordii TaxID=458696 RepID=A0A7J7D3B0_TRIWF|nr:zinc finger protein GAI-ASSOCIATED FACTOR 1-like [Tripterygium wilfordii]KAF5740758.1 protein indeterminate-domain 2-like [Tripterygium wilfordii]